MDRIHDHHQKRRENIEPKEKNGCAAKEEAVVRQRVAEAETENERSTQVGEFFY